MKVAFIGGGNMGAAFAGAFINSGLVEGKDIVFVEPVEDRRKFLELEFGASTQESIDESISAADWVVLAVKPQDSEGPFSRLAKVVKQDVLLISVMTGIRIRHISKATGIKKVVRCMPNTPILVDSGVIAYRASDDVSIDQLAKLKKALNSMGLAVPVDSADLIDAATSISASGAGFAFYFAEHMAKGAVELGYSEKDAEAMVRETIAGAMELWKKADKSISELRQQVTSKGGTTFAGLNVLNERKVDQAIKDCLKAAYDRAVELSKS